ncbi:unnamed protein product, partial [marine sediment metagenome]
DDKIYSVYIIRLAFTNHKPIVTHIDYGRDV